MLNIWFNMIKNKIIEMIRLNDDLITQFRYKIIHDILAKDNINAP